MLWLNFKDENGTPRKVEISADRFTVGRHSACDLTYADSRLSREHIVIIREHNNYVVEDVGSSNGTLLNGSRLASSATLKDGDILDLGGGLELLVAIEVAAEPSPEIANAGAETTDVLEPASTTAVSAPAVPVETSVAEGIPTAVFIVGPLLALLVLAIVIGGVFLLGNNQSPSTSDSNGVVYPDDSEDVDRDPIGDRSPEPKRTPSPGPGSKTPDGPPASPAPPQGSDTPAADTSDVAKVERHGAEFVRQIAQNDPRAFLTGEQAQKVKAKLRQVARPSLAENLNGVRKNAAGIRSLASSKNLKPQFLAVAAIVKLGGGRGDVLQAAQTVADVYDKLAIQIGNENFDDALLLVAAYDQGVAGDTMKMRNMLQEMASKPGSPGTREIRSIWYLEKNGRISQAEYERALIFLAVGTIAQNPREFGVNAEALRL